MFKFPDGLYTDVRIENVYQSKVAVTSGDLDETKVRSYRGAFVRVFDGERWYYSSISDVDNIQQEIDQLASFARPTTSIKDHPVVSRLQIHQNEALKFKNDSVSDISIEEKRRMLEGYSGIMDLEPLISSWKSVYLDKRVIKEIYSSKGTQLRFDSQYTWLQILFNFAAGEDKFMEIYARGSDVFSGITDKGAEISDHINRSVEFMHNAQPLKPGRYTVVLSPAVAGVFAHESFGHKSEADFMIGDERMKQEWQIGKKVGFESLSIIDDGNIAGVGYTPYDDEGTRAEKTYLIRDGKIAGRLHSGRTAASLDEEITGNARAVNFEYEPIVRMTTTYIAPGNMTKEELFAGVKEGIYLDTYMHGSGLSTFTIAPNMAYYIKDGKLAEPVHVSVVTGNVLETLGDIDGISDTLELYSVAEGCGKKEQRPLPVGFGGPYIRVRNMNVR